MAKKAGKKKKKSKEEVEAERVAAEEAERVRLAEEKRLRLEAERKEKERLRKEEEERQKRRAAEIARLGAESDIVVARLQSQMTALKQVRVVEASAQEWGKYVSCSTTPDPEVEHEMTTFLIKWRANEDFRLEKLVKFWHEANTLIAALEGQLARALGEEDDQKVAMCLEYRWKTHELIKEKVDAITAHIVSHLDQQKQKKTEYVFIAGKALDMTRMGLWVNVNSAGFRARPVHFVDDDTKIECSVVVPKALVLVSIALRVLIQKNKDVVQKPTEHTDQAEVYAKAAELFQVWQATTLKNGSKEYMRIFDGVRCNLLTTSFDELPETARAQYVSRAADMFRWKSLVDRSRPLSAIGGVLTLELIKIPQGAQKVKSWTMRPVGEFSKTAEKCTYPLAGTPASHVVQPIQVVLKLPSDIIVPKKVVVGRWDEAKQDWATDGILDIQYKEEDNTVSFSTLNIGQLAVLHPRSSSLPVTHWSMKPKEFGVVLFTMQSTLCTVQIQITKEGCALLKPDRPELKSLLGKTMSPCHLLMKLACCNLNCSFKDSDAESTDLKCKSAIERNIYRDISLLASGFEISSSRWNQQRPESEAIFRVQEASDDAMTNGPSTASTDEDRDRHTKGAEDEWWTLNCVLDAETKQGVKYTLLDLKEDAKEFSAKEMLGEIPHAALELCLTEDKCSETALEVVQLSDPRLQTYTRQLLNAIRPISFA